MPPEAARGLPPFLLGATTGAARRHAARFYAGVGELLERWLAARPSPHTRRAYAADLMSFAAFFGIAWPAEAWKLFACSALDVERWREAMLAEGQSAKSVNRRLSAVSSFCKHVAAAAVDERLPIAVPNPAQGQLLRP